MTIDTPALPASYEWGFVVGQIIEAIADQAGDADRFPESRPMLGTVRFEPLEEMRTVTTPVQAFVAHKKVTVNLNDDGELIDADGLPGIWLVTGAYRVSFQLVDATIPAFNIEVLAAHTIAAPLDLATVAPYVPPTGTTATVMLIPSGAYAYAILGWGGAGLEWQPNPTSSIPDIVQGAVQDYLTANPPSGSPDATTLTKGIVRLAGDLSGTADAPTVPGLADKAAAIHTHDDRYYTETETDLLLAGKQAAGDYAAATHNHTGTYAAATHNHTGTYAPALGPDDNYVTDAEKAALHTHPAVIAQGTTAAAARTAIGAGTSSFSGAYADLTGKPTLGTAAATASSTYATAAQGDKADTALQVATPQPINAQTGTAYTLVAADAGKLVTLTNAAAITLTVPGSVFTTGQRVDVLVLGAGKVTVVGSSCTVNGTPSLVSREQYSAFTVVFTSATTAVVIGDLASA